MSKLSDFTLKTTMVVWRILNLGIRSYPTLMPYSNRMHARALDYAITWDRYKELSDTGKAPAFKYVKCKECGTTDTGDEYIAYYKYKGRILCECCMKHKPEVRNA